MINKVIDYDEIEIDQYLKYLRMVGALSALFSESEVPLLHYRAAENIFCRAFNATNLARDDVSVDAKYGDYGIGIKTFIEGTKRTYQKIAEFNQQQKFYQSLPPLDKIKQISKLRNKRLEFTQNAYDVDSLIYHCVVRNKTGFHLFEEVMQYIETDSVTLVDAGKGKSIKFTDGRNEYRFDLSKSTLYKKFITEGYFAHIDVAILEDPLIELMRLNLEVAHVSITDALVLPLYSNRGKSPEKVVHQRSGLNQWNANGRLRHPDEVYIPFPKETRFYFDTFFPDRNHPFEVVLPNGKTMSMKVCQDDGKAIMSNPNKALGHWILREVLKIPEGEVVTYDTLLTVGIDSVIFIKSEGKYHLGFRPIGSYEKFLEETVLSDIT